MKKYILSIFLSLTIFGSIQAQQTVYVSGDNLYFRTDTVINAELSSIYNELEYYELIEEEE
ncbi:MAG: hypothetical protein ISR55_02045 [Bacteroidetes bacterium]|nr:hypothetical protein [Bacteroidota bacterium]